MPSPTLNASYLINIFQTTEESIKSVPSANVTWGGCDPRSELRPADGPAMVDAVLCSKKKARSFFLIFLLTIGFAKAMEI